MKKVLSIMLLAALLVTTVIVPVSAEGAAPASIPQSSRDDVIVLFDGSMDNLTMQHPTASLTELYEDENNYVQGDRSLFVDMPEDGIPFIVNFALMLKITTEDIVSIREYPISELSLYNHMDTKKGDAIQINYVDPDNTAGAGDDSYNKNFGVDGWEPGWHLLRHKVEDSRVFGEDAVNPDNIDHIRISWTVANSEGNIDYAEVDWNFDCLLIAKQSFFDDRAVAETEMIGIIDGLETPTAENFDAVKESIVNAKAKLDGYLDEFPNFMVESQDKAAQMDKIWAAYQAIEGQKAASVIIEKIDALGELTLANYKDKMAEIEGIETEIKDFTDQGYSKKLITNADVLEAAKTAAARLGVEESIDALPAADAVTLEDEARINEVKTAFDALPAEQQNLIAQEKRDKIQTLLAKLVEKKIDALPAVDAVTLDDEARINEIKAAFVALTAEQQSAVAQASQDKLAALLDKIDWLKTPYTLGDVNDDDKIDASDALMALQASVSLITLTDNQKLAADVNGDDKVDASDALMMLQVSVDLIKAEDFPAAKK